MPGQRSDRDTLRSRRHRSIRASQRTNAACRQCRPAPVGSVGGSAPACPCIAGTAATSTASASSGTRNPRATVPDNDNDNNKEHICVSGRHQRLQATPAELFLVRYRRCHPAYSGSSRSLHRRGTPCHSARPMDRCSRAHCAAALTTRVSQQQAPSSGAAQATYVSRPLAQVWPRSVQHSRCGTAADPMAVTSVCVVECARRLRDVEVEYAARREG